MRLVVGLGNPGEKYKNNRHNVGFMFIDYLIKELTGSRVNELEKKKMLHVICYVLHDVILVKPQTFMNQSGLAVKSCVTRFALHVSHDLVVVHDDLDIPLGKFKIQKGVGPKLHNGIQSIEKELGTKDFWRVRIGVDNRQKNDIDGTAKHHVMSGAARHRMVSGETYVLQDFIRKEKEILINQVFPKISERLKKEFC